MSLSINQVKLHDLIQSYKADFADNICNELYKWRAVAHFQQHWDINASDFKAMLETALNFNDDNLLAGAMYFPKRMIWRFAEFDKDAVKDMFVNLFDEEQDLAERINAFSASADNILKRWNPEKNHYQDYRAISTYLWLMFPDKYFIYKADCVAALVTQLGLGYKRQNKLKGQNVVNVYAIYNQVADVLKQDEELRNMLEANLSDDCYSDPEARTLAIDFGYYLKAYYQKDAKKDVAPDKQQRIWLYAPGEEARMWDDCISDGQMYLGWDQMGDLTKYESRDAMTAKLKEIYGAEKSYKNDSLAVWEFANVIKEGDIIYAKRGRKSIIGRGVVRGGYVFDSTREEYLHARSVDWEIQGNWETEDLQPMKTLTDISKYPDLLSKLDLLVAGDSTPQSNQPMSDKLGFWWLNANPKIWSLNEWSVGTEQSYSLLNANGNKRRIYQNFIDAKVGDKIICYESNPTKQILCLAELSRESDGDTISFKKTETLSTPIDLASFKEVAELQKMEFLVNPNGSFFKLTKEEYDVLMDIIRESNVPVAAKVKTPYTKEKFLEEVYMAESDYDNLYATLQLKQNIILQGAPGVGKTFSAKRLAYSIMGEVDDDRVGFVQFHQNYSYEDFVMGYKPNCEGGFDLQRGIFYKFCIKAANDPDRKYFFIIDEINRGNLSKIFGELLMLIEKDYRGDKITLAYSEERFSVPENLYIIGMMNTADRSLAMIDYALRRRFSFFPMKPGFETAGFKKYQSQLGNTLLDALIAKIQELNNAIVADETLGAGFEIGHSYFCGQNAVTEKWLHAVVHYEIIPMLEEYWFDNKQRVEDWSKSLKSAIND